MTLSHFSLNLFDISQRESRFELTMRMGKDDGNHRITFLFALLSCVIPNIPRKEEN
jgi:hypothetical protein